MKAIYSFILFGLAAIIISCQKAPELTLNGPTSIELSADGSRSTFTFTANRDWTARASDSWVIVSPSSGTATDGLITVTVSCAANTTYDDRTATVTIKMEELTQTVSIRQPANLDIILPTYAFDLTSDARSLELTVQANVQYSVVIDGNWIKQKGTKGLTTDKLTFNIEENKTYDAREGKITIKSQNSSVADQVVSVRQAPKDALIVKDSSFDMPYGGGEIEIRVEANVEFDVTPNVDWIQYLETKALSNSTIRLSVAENATFSSREGKIEITQKNGSLKHTVTVMQAGRVAVTSITLNKTELKLKEGESETLVATIKPDNATEKTVTWTSNDTSIATVDADGKVTAVSTGNTTISASAGNASASCYVYVRSASIPVPSGAVDLGLSVAWGEKNLGAESAYGAGNYYFWGDPTGNALSTSFKTPEIDFICDTQYDIAKVTLGNGWRLPTKGEISELFYYCTWEVVSNGVRLTGPNGNSIILPLTGVATPKDSPTEALKISLEDYGFIMSGESYWDSSYGRFAYIGRFDQTLSYNWVAFNVLWSTFPVRPVYENREDEIPVSSISLNKVELSLNEGESETLVATVLPNDATDKTVTWFSSNTSVASVDASGKVTGVKEGSASITAQAGQFSAICDVTVSSKGGGVPAGAVDLGLSVFWANCDLGSNDPLEPGLLYAWGETESKTDFTIQNYKYSRYDTYTHDYYYTKYNNTDHKTILDPEDDAATVNLGGKWRTPTMHELSELFVHCTWAVESTDYGYVIKGTASNGNSIILTVAHSTYSGSGGKHYVWYWSNELSQYMEFNILFNGESSGTKDCYDSRYLGHLIRPVSDK